MYQVNKYFDDIVVVVLVVFFLYCYMLVQTGVHIKKFVNIMGGGIMGPYNVKHRIGYVAIQNRLLL